VWAEKAKALHCAGKVQQALDAEATADVWLRRAIELRTHVKKRKRAPAIAGPT